MSQPLATSGSYWLPWLCSCRWTWWQNFNVPWCTKACGSVGISARKVATMHSSRFWQESSMFFYSFSLEEIKYCFYLLFFWKHSPTNFCPSYILHSWNLQENHFHYIIAEDTYVYMYNPEVCQYTLKIWFQSKCIYIFVP